MPTVEMHPDDIQAAATVIPEDVPVTMLNLLRYRVQADYGDRAGEAPCTGREAYFQRYVAAFNQVEGAKETKVIWFGTALANVIAPAGEHWDDIVLVEYPSFAAFRRIVESADYKTHAEHHRAAALEDSRLIAATQTSL